MKKFISLADPVLGEEEKEALCKVIDSGWLTMGERVREFEKEFSKIHGVKDAVAVSSCTSALHLILSALGIGPDHEVLVPSLTFVATVNAVLYTGAKPVFIDIESQEVPHISLENARKSINERTRVVIVMHYGGYVMDMKKWRSLANEFGLYLIEDAAHAPGGKDVGRFSHAAAFSFFTNKNMTSAEGGMVVSNDLNLLEKVRAMRSHGMTTLTLDRYKGHAFSYDVTMLGYNYRMDELRAALGLAQLSRLNKWNEKRLELSLLYRRFFLERCPEIKVPFDEKWPTTAHLMPVLLPKETDRKNLMDKLKEAGIQSSIHYPPVHNFSFYRRRFPGIFLKETEEFSKRVITLPLHPGLDEEDVKYTVNQMEKALG